MRVVSVNIASFIEDASQIFGSKVKTGIYKRPQSGRVKVDFSGLEGDVICNSKHHGGADQAVYAYSMEDYMFWRHSLTIFLSRVLSVTILPCLALTLVPFALETF